ncbi:MAG: helix-turn-helix domain-containing protein [Oscillospiraceae bacterium]|jgi:predicted XRE-type DNA-binding protein|nr:helix-turn-helix domain-containing protein [Oscillospiraceae bacterium]
MMINGEEFTTFEDIWERSSLTQAEKDEIQLKIELSSKFIEARDKENLTQQQLADMSGLKQPAIARLQRMQSTPQISTILKVLSPLGYKLAIVPNDLHPKQV